MRDYVDQAMLRWAARSGRYEVLEPLRRQRAQELLAAGQPLPPAHAAAARAAAEAADEAEEAEEAWEVEVDDVAAPPKGEAAARLAARRGDSQPEARAQQRRRQKARRRGKALVGAAAPSYDVAAEEK